MVCDSSQKLSTEHDVAGMMAKVEATFDCSYVLMLQTRKFYIPDFFLQYVESNYFVHQKKNVAALTMSMYDCGTQ